MNRSQKVYEECCNWWHSNKERASKPLLLRHSRCTRHISGSFLVSFCSHSSSSSSQSSQPPPRAPLEMTHLPPNHKKTIFFNLQHYPRENSQETIQGGTKKSSWIEEPNWKIKTFSFVCERKREKREKTHLD